MFHSQCSAKVNDSNAHSLHFRLSPKAQVHNCFRTSYIKYHSHTQLGINAFYGIFQHIHLSNWTRHQELWLNWGRGQIDTTTTGKDYNPITGNCIMPKINKNRDVNGCFPYQRCFTFCNYFKWSEIVNGFKHTLEHNFKGMSTQPPGVTLKAELGSWGKVLRSRENKSFRTTQLAALKTTAKIGLSRFQSWRTVPAWITHPQT